MRNISGGVSWVENFEEVQIDVKAHERTVEIINVGLFRIIFVNY